MSSSIISNAQTGTALKQFRLDVLHGLRMSQKTLPSKYFYDQRGSQLFDRICEQSEYYPTRTEIAIMRKHAEQMAELVGPATMLIELGSGSSMKTGELLRHLPRPVCYVPVDISREHLLEAADRIAQQFPDIEVAPVSADFSTDFDLPETETNVDRRVVYFPGSTIGNFRPHDATKLLARIAALVGDEGGLLVGFDLHKDRQTLENAYNDAAGLTAGFNKNLLRRMNQELESNFSLDQFQHRAIYNDSMSRIEMHLVSNHSQQVKIGEDQIEFEAGETIRTELSHKYHIESFAQLAIQAGFDAGQVWTDPRELFAVGYYSVEL